MSFNPLLARAPGSDGLVPAPAAGERFILKRKGIVAALKIDKTKFEGKGSLYLTDQRLVFIKDGDVASHKKWSSFQLLLVQLHGSAGLGHPPDFKQPVFGANHLAGFTPPAPASQYPFAADTEWSLTFKEGGCAAFVKAFYALERAARNSPQRLAQVANEIISGAAVYVDPTDPSVIFVQQPTPAEHYAYNAATQTYARSIQPQGPAFPLPPAHQPFGAYPPPPGGNPAPYAGYGAPPGGYPAPQGYAPLPPGGYPAPPNGYAPPPGGYVPPPQPFGSYPPPPGGYAAPPQGYPAPPGGYPAPPGGYPAPPVGYPAPPGGYPAPPVGYPAPPGGYPAPPGGYAAPPAGFAAPPLEAARGIPPSGPPAPASGTAAAASQNPNESGTTVNLTG